MVAMGEDDGATVGRGSHERAVPSHPPGTAPFLPESWWRLSLERRREVAGGVVALTVLLVGLVAFLALRGGGGGSDEVSAAPATTTSTTIDAAAYVDALAPARVSDLRSLAECESGSDWSDDTGNGFYGGLQFTLESWQAVGGTGNPAQASEDEQIMRGDLLEKRQGWVAWPACAAELGLS